ncbi:arylcarboxylate reductase [Streptomyces sp. SL13]|jgi:hypothetical protein|uniref:Arylcarboxylate reductase n=1 Tax=Streptantibioticus silvisoli TaxID=2705255 RepID=A0AA90JW77_9ACTN|nr:arylcarboxylate reductase [Streptantibioticus silvisoli]MDI5968711.1 arylcarboxylate reductase [Streptantibioticus silvisoli]
MTVYESPDVLSDDRPPAVDLDAWTRHVVRCHFDATSGSPFWLKRRGSLGFDPFDVTRYAELAQFGPLTQDVLREVDPVDLLPQGLPRPLTGPVYDRAGSSGRPCRILQTGAMREHRAAWRERGLREAGFRPDGTWLYAAPGGPHPAGQGSGQTALAHAAVVYGIDLDWRWVKQLMRQARLTEVNRYVDHLVGQITDVLAGAQVDYLQTTPALFQALVQRRPDLAAKLAGVGLSGSRVLPAMYRQFTEALDGGVVGLTYENAFGAAMGLPAEDGGAVLPYLPHYPQVTMTVVDRNDPARIVEYGKVGQLRLTLLHEDLFLPNVMERDQAIRHRTGPGRPCDAVANIQPLQPTWAVPDGIH